MNRTSNEVPGAISREEEECGEECTKVTVLKELQIGQRETHLRTEGSATSTNNRARCVSDVARIDRELSRYGEMPAKKKKKREKKRKTTSKTACTSIDNEEARSEIRDGGGHATR